MDKIYADKMIEKYQTMFYGFALSKTYTIDEAEELAARIVLEAYVTLLKVDDISNWDGYLYRIASGVYARYVKEIKRNSNFAIDDMEITSDVDFTKEIMQSEDYKLIKREISWLSKIQREIIYMHYYENNKISYISHALNLPVGTVKWHLHDAKKIMKEGMEIVRNSGELGIKPVSFCNMGHNGWAGDKGDTSDFLNTKLRQNIAYSAYFDAKTVSEIATELGVSPVFIEDEVDILEEYGFLDKLSGNKYLTNIKIDNVPLIAFDEIINLQKEISKIICDEYVPLLESKFINYHELGIYIPENDFGYLLWSLVPMSLGGQFWDKAFSDSCLLEGTHYRVKRKDGGDFIAHASIADNEKDLNINAHFISSGDMTRGSMQYPVASWQLSSDFDLREFGWRDNLTSDFESLYLFMIGKMDKNEATLDKFRRLYDRGLIINNNGKDEINVVVVNVHRDDNNKVNGWSNDLFSLLPAYPDNMIRKVKEKTHLIYEIEKKYYPKHMHKLVEYYANLDINKIMVLDELVERGVLKPLTEAQKKGVMTVIFSDTLPN
ncbi:sigma-70 family RNA polymerase sigma factor [Lachnoclostridium sp.]|nr:sigma-70 family RNA polymerase sigma factor [Lachnoclostridium sp.]